MGGLMDVGPMDVVIDRVSGLDIHRDTVMAAVRVPGSLLSPDTDRWRPHVSVAHPNRAGLASLSSRRSDAGFRGWR